MMSKQVVPLNLFRLTKLTENDDETINFCKTFGLFPTDIRCPNCDMLLDKLYHFKNRNATTFRYQCNKRLCRRKESKTLLHYVIILGSMKLKYLSGNHFL